MSPNKKIEELTELYLKWSEGDSKDQNWVKKLKDEGNWAELARVMEPRVAFGTAGIRAKMEPG